MDFKLSNIDKFKPVKLEIVFSSQEDIDWFFGYLERGRVKLNDYSFHEKYSNSNFMINNIMNELSLKVEVKPDMLY